LRIERAVKSTQEAGERESGIKSGKVVKNHEWERCGSVSANEVTRATDARNNVNNVQQLVKFTESRITALNCLSMRVVYYLKLLCCKSMH
jgi:hypothetical protein